MSASVARRILISGGGMTKAIVQSVRPFVNAAQDAFLTEVRRPRMKEKKRIPASNEPFPWKNPFALLKDAMPQLTSTGPPVRNPVNTAASALNRNRGRVDILRSTAHRGGKTVTVVTGFVGISQSEKERLAKEMQKTCGAGGTVKEGRIEIQGDHRDTVARILANAGFRPVFAGD